MFEIKVEVKDSSDPFSADALRKEIADQVRERLRFLRCPEHGTTVHSATIIATSMDAFQFEYTPECCKKFDATVRKAAHGA